MKQNLRALTDAERIDWLRLARSENVGPVTFHRLIERFGSAKHALERLSDLAKYGGKRSYRAYPISLAQAELDRLANIDGRIIAWVEPEYPIALRAIDDAPPVLTVTGRFELLTKPRQISLVGARNASANGKRFAHDLARELAAAGMIVVSGLARGIDGAAHAGALAVNGGTIAVLAGGVDVIYPPEHATLYERLCQHGLIVAEMPAGTEPQAKLFPRRNRVISGLSLATIVIEAALKSGSLITARFANEQGREVMAVPGSPLDPRCRGTNQLIREGALLIEDARQVLEALSENKVSSLNLFKNLNNDTQHIDYKIEEVSSDLRGDILNLLSPSPVEVDELLRQCHCSAPVLGMALLELDLAGRLERHPGNRVSLLAKVA